MKRDSRKDRVLVNQAVGLLQDKNLVWSADFEAIREPLARWLNSETLIRPPGIFAVQIADALLIEENDLTVR